MEYYYRRLRDLREDHDMLQRDVAEYLGIHTVQYLKYEKGHREIPVHLLLRLADLYNTSTDYLLGRTANPGPPEKISE